jgi:hypothetical protein
MTVLTRKYAFANCRAILIAGALAMLPAVADAASTDAQHTIVVVGEGQTVGVPNQARITAGVVTQAQTAIGALDSNSQAMNNVFAAVKQLGIPENKIRTANFSIQPQYPPIRPDNSQPRVIIGYQVTNQVTLLIDDISKVGTALDALVRSGANQTYGIVFGFADPKPLNEKARAAAVVDAMEKAKTLADAAHVSLGPVLNVQDGVAGQVGFTGLAAVAQAVNAPPVAQGEQNVTVRVTMTFAIQ